MDGRWGDWLEDWSWNALVVLFYLPVANGAVLYLWLVGGEHALFIRTIGEHPGRDAALGAVVGICLAIPTRFAHVTPVGRRFLVALGRIIGRPSWAACVVLSVFSALGEELLFRGVIQERLGLWVAAGLFATVHVPIERDLWPWPITSFLGGLALGGLYVQTETVLAPVVAHLVLNLANLRWISRRYGVSAYVGTDSAS